LAKSYYFVILPGNLNSGLTFTYICQGRNKVVLLLILNPRERIGFGELSRLGRIGSQLLAAKSFKFLYFSMEMFIKVILSAYNINGKHVRQP
jgi:hypothetical protein